MTYSFTLQWDRYPQFDTEINFNSKPNVNQFLDLADKLVLRKLRQLGHTKETANEMLKKYSPPHAKIVYNGSEEIPDPRLHEDDPLKDDELIRILKWLDEDEDYPFMTPFEVVRIASGRGL